MSVLAKTIKKLKNKNLSSSGRGKERSFLGRVCQERLLTEGDSKDD